MTYVKDEGFNLQTCATTLNSNLSRGHLNMQVEPFDSFCSKHALVIKSMSICHFR